MSEYTINPIIWFAERELNYPPAHFVTANTYLTLDSKQWVLDNLVGRFSITPNVTDIFNVENLGVISFEDPKEAMIYELKWS